MKFDVLEFVQNYNLFYSITGTHHGAAGLYVFSVVFIFIVSFTINGLTLGRWLPRVKGKSAIMSLALVALITFIGEAFYSFLELFKIPLAWLYKYWWAIFIGIIVLLVIYGIVSVIIEERNQNNTP